MKKFFTYPVFVVLFLSLIGSIGFGAIVKYHYDGGKKFKFLQKTAIIISSVPMNFRNMVKHKTTVLDKLNLALPKHRNKKRYEKFIEDERNGLLVSSRYDYSLSRSVVDIIDLKNFKTIHNYNSC